MRIILLVFLAAAVTGCDSSKTIESPAAPAASDAPVVDMHTSRNSLDWSGDYEGVLACENCPGIHTRLTLGEDGAFEIVTRRLAPGAAPSSAQGRFEWESDGNTVVLDAAGGGWRFAVGEGRLLLRDAGQTWASPDAVLARVSPGGESAGQPLAGMLQDHRWTLVNATDAANSRIDVLFPDPERPFEFSFAESRLHAEGGCNGIRGGFRISADDKLEVTGMMSTQMACAAPLMQADAALAGLLAAPLELVPVGGAQPSLVMFTAGGDALVLSGELTPEARFGPPTRMFLEVADQTVACDESPRGDGTCLQVRELSFDEQGLMVGTPSEWQAFHGHIQGYEHQPGIRNVLRVKRFEPAAGAGLPAAPVYVLDLVVQSEVVPQ
jgi:heat shock protein HslJ